jgi:hypothetical protein
MQAIQAASAATMAIVTILAIIVAVTQIRAAQFNAREVAARDAFREFIQTSIEHAESADGDKRPENTFDQMGYLMFVILMLHALEEVLAYCLNENESAWRATVRYYLGKHRGILSDPRFISEIYVTCSKVLCEAMDDVTKRGWTATGGETS